MRRNDDDWTPWVLGLAGVCTLVTVLALLIWAGVRDQRAKAACEESGGRVEQYNCYTTQHCTTHHVNKYTSYTTCYPITSCSWRCAGLPAEHP